MHHVVFVDDDPAVLAGIRRMLHPRRASWRMTFASSADAALAVLAEDPADVLVSDMRMPGMDGAQLLSLVRQRWPGTVRMILSGYAEQGAAMRSVPVAHRFVSKPCERDALVAVLREACELQDRLSRPELRQLLGSLGALPSPPGSYAAITEELTRPQADSQSVAEIIERDPGCTTKLLQLVNSAFFGLARSVTSVRDAVTYLGVGSVRNVVLAAEVADLFRCESPELAAAAMEIGRHSTAVAVAARARVPKARAQDAFVTGVLHDIGRLALATTAPELFTALRRDHERGVPLVDAERERLGVTHGDIGGYLLRLWGLPFWLIAPVTRHHDPGAVDDDDPVVAAVAALHDGVDCG